MINKIFYIYIYNMINYKEKYIKYKNKYLKYKCNENLANSLKDNCIKDETGEFLNLETCVTSDKCLKIQSDIINKLKYSRLDQYNFLIKRLADYKDINSQNYCIGKNIHDINIINYISSGVNGEVEKAEIDKIKVAIKKQPLSSNEYGRIMELSNQYKTESWAEIYAMKLGNKLFLNNITPHISLIYSYFICNDCKYKNVVLQKKPKNCVYIINELATNDLHNWRLEYHSVQEWYIMLFQIIYTLLAYHYTYGLSHGDLHAKNILYDKIEINDTYNKYIFFDKSIIIKNNGYLFKLYDFAKATSPFIKNKEYTNDNIIIHRNKDIIKLFNDLIFNNEDNKDIKPIPEPVYSLLNETYNKLIPDLDLSKLNELNHLNYINIIDDLLINIGKQINNDTSDNIINTYTLNKRKYFTTENLISGLGDFIQKQNHNAKQTKECPICTFMNPLDSLVCEICGYEF